MGFIIILAFFGLLPLLPAKIAQSKGREFGLWYVYGFFLFLIAIIHALLLSPTQAALDDRAAADGMRKCPDCAEMIRAEAKKCRYCGAALDETQSSVSGIGGKPTAWDLRLAAKQPGVSGHDDMIEAWRAREKG